MKYQKNYIEKMKESYHNGILCSSIEEKQEVGKIIGLEWIGGQENDKDLASLWPFEWMVVRCLQ